jgi:Carboxymuconolactone decarboxylase family
MSQVVVFLACTLMPCLLEWSCHKKSRAIRDARKRRDETMSRIPPINDIEIPEGEAVSFSTMSTLFRTMAHRPELMQQTIQLLETAMRTGTVDQALKELLAVRVSQVNHCFY